MIENEKGLTLVELLATLTLLSLVTGIVWTTVSIATQFNVAETTTLRLQQEANYIISELQQVHRNCYEYELTYSREEIKVDKCKKDDVNSTVNYDGIISNRFYYLSAEKASTKFVKTYNSRDNNLELPELYVIDPVKEKRFVKVPTTISRFKDNSTIR